MKHTTVTITKGKHASQKYTVLIQPPNGEAYKLRQRYARVYTAKRGALRNLDARAEYLNLYGRVVLDPFEMVLARRVINYTTPKRVPIKFIVK